MQFNQGKIWAGTAVLATALFFTGCKKDPVKPEQEVQTTIDQSIASAEFSSISTIVDLEARTDTALYGNKTTGTTGSGLFCTGSTTQVTILSANSAELVIDFGSGSTCYDGRTREGIITAVFNGKWKDAGSTITITPTNYKLDGMEVDFSKVMTSNGRNGAGNLNWDVAITNATIVTTDGTISYESNRNTEWVAGEGDLDPTTNEYLISGDASGTSRFGKNFSAVIDSPLRVEASCKYVTEGVLSITPEALVTRSIDYGDGTCDNLITLSVGGFSYDVTLPE